MRRAFVCIAAAIQIASPLRAADVVTISLDGSISRRPETAEETANREAAAAVAEAAMAAPQELSRVSYTNGWSVRILDDGAELIWRHRNPPYDPVVDAAQYAAAVASNAALRVELRALRDTIATNITDCQSIDPTAWTGAQRVQAQAIRRELIDSNQAMRDVVRMLRAMRREDNQ